MQARAKEVKRVVICIVWKEEGNSKDSMDFLLQHEPFYVRPEALELFEDRPSKVLMQANRRDATKSKMSIGDLEFGSKLVTPTSLQDFRTV